MFPRQLAPAYYDRIVAACERAGFQPRVQAFQDPPVIAMLARLPGGREVGLTPASFAFHAAEAEPGIVAREIVDPPILVSCRSSGLRAPRLPQSRASWTARDGAPQKMAGFAPRIESQRPPSSSPVLQHQDERRRESAGPSASAAARPPQADPRRRTADLEPFQGRLSGSEFLQSPPTASASPGLMPLSQLLIEIDQALEEPGGATEAFLERDRRLFAPPNPATPFGRRYLGLLQQSPDVVVAHSSLMQVLTASARP